MNEFAEKLSIVFNSACILEEFRLHSHEIQSLRFPRTDKRSFFIVYTCRSNAVYWPLYIREQASLHYIKSLLSIPISNSTKNFQVVIDDQEEYKEMKPFSKLLPLSQSSSVVDPATWRNSSTNNVSQHNFILKFVYTSCLSAVCS